jgi:hypothetical protein
MNQQIDSKPSRYKLLNGSDLAQLPPLVWLVKGVLPATGIAGIYGPSGSGKSFLCLDLAIAIANGKSWFGRRVNAAPVVYAGLEGEAGFKQRVDAWRIHFGQSLPANLHFMLQPFKLPLEEDVEAFANVLPKGCVVFIDTLNRAAPTSDENNSKDMGTLIEAAKRLQALTDGLVVLVHHTGKNASAGLRGHSSLIAALDAAIEVSRDGESRQWSVAKAKDGEDGNCERFRLKVETVGLDSDGDPVTSCVVEKDNSIAIVKKVVVPQGTNQKLVLEALRPMFKDGTTGKAGAPPQAKCIELEKAVVSGGIKLTCPSDKRASRAREAITGLAARGVLGLNDGWLWQIT